MNLPNRNEITKDNKVGSLNSNDRQEIVLEKQKNQILEFACKQGQVTRKEVENLLAAGLTKASRLLRELCDEGRLRQVDNGKLSCYVPNNRMRIDA